MWTLCIHPKKRYFVRWTKIDSLFTFLQHRDSTLDINQERCILWSLSILTIFFHISMTHFNNLLLKIQMLSNWTIIFSPWKLIPPKYPLTLIPWKSTYMVLLCLPWNTRFSYLFWIYVLLQIFNKHFTIQNIDGTLFG